MKAIYWIVGLGGLVTLAWPRSASASPNGDTTDVSTIPANSDGVSEGIRDLALAIAHAEGYFVPGSIPDRAHNPGDLVIPGWTGARLGDQGISVFRDDAEGWARLHHQLALIASGRSSVYSLDLTLSEMGQKWTQTQSSDWTRNVIDYLNAHDYQVSADSTLWELNL